MGIQISDGEVDDAVEQVLAHAAHDPLAQVGAHQALKQRADGGEHIKPYHRKQNGGEPPKVEGGNGIDGAALQARREHRADDDPRHHQQQPADHQPLVVKILQQLADRLLSIHRLFGEHAMGPSRPAAAGPSRAGAHARALWVVLRFFRHSAHPPCAAANYRYPDRWRTPASAARGCHRPRCARHRSRRCGRHSLPRRCAGR